MNSDTLPSTVVRRCSRWLSELKDCARKAFWETQLLCWALSSKQRQRTPFLWVLVHYFPYASSKTCSGQWESFLSVKGTSAPSHTQQDDCSSDDLFSFAWSWMLTFGKVLSKEEIYILKAHSPQILWKTTNTLCLSFSTRIWLYISN